MLTAIHLRHNLAKEQQQEGEQDGDHHKLQPLAAIAKEMTWAKK